MSTARVLSGCYFSSMTTSVGCKLCPFVYRWQTNRPTDTQKREILVGYCSVYRLPISMCIHGVCCVNLSYFTPQSLMTLYYNNESCSFRLSCIYNVSLNGGNTSLILSYNFCRKTCSSIVGQPEIFCMVIESSTQGFERIALAACSTFSNRVVY